MLDSKNQFCVFGFRFFVPCKSQNKRSQKTKVPLIFKCMESNLHHPVFYFISVKNLIRHGAFSQNSLWYTSTVQVEIKFYIMSDIEKLNVLKRYLKYRSPRQRTQMLKIEVSWFVNPSWFLEVLKDEGTSIFSVKNFYVFQMTQHNTP